jgi:hypothetical protein
VVPWPVDGVDCEVVCIYTHDGKIHRHRQSDMRHTS